MGRGSSATWVCWPCGCVGHRLAMVLGPKASPGVQSQLQGVVRQVGVRIHLGEPRFPVPCAGGLIRLDLNHGSEHAGGDERRAEGDGRLHRHAAGEHQH